MQPFLALILSSIATICFGTATFLSSKSAKDMGALQTLFLFQLLGIPVFFFLFPFAPTHITVAWLPIFLVGAFQAFNMLLWFYALKVGNVSIISPVSEVYSLITVVLGVIFLHESVGLLKGIGILSIFSGVVLLSVQLSLLRQTRRIALYTGITPALLYAIGVAIFYLWTTILTRQSGWFWTALGIRIAIVVVTFFLLVLQKKKIFSHVSWKWIGIAGLLDGFGFAIFNSALTFSPVSYVAVVVSAQSVITVILAYLFFKEKLQVYQLIGLMGVVIGLIFLQFH